MPPAVLRTGIFGGGIDEDVTKFGAGANPGRCGIMFETPGGANGRTMKDLEKLKKYRLTSRYKMHLRDREYR